MDKTRLVLTLLITAALGTLATQACATLGSSKFNDVTMIYVGGDSCVVVDKDPAVIYHNKRPKRVRWMVTVQGKYWEIHYQPTPGSSATKKAGTGDYFANSGPLEIGCDKSAVPTDPPGPSPAKASWPYKIRVYACDGQSKGEFLCELDPMIDWGD